MKHKKPIFFPETALKLEQECQKFNHKYLPKDIKIKKCPACGMSIFDRNHIERASLCHFVIINAFEQIQNASIILRNMNLDVQIITLNVRKSKPKYKQGINKR